MYLEPFVEDLVQFWKGVVAYDVLKNHRSMVLKLQAVLLWMIHNFPRYGTMVLPIKAMLRVRFVDRISKVITQLKLERKRTRTLGGGYHMTTHGGLRQ